MSGESCPVCGWLQTSDKWYNDTPPLYEVKAELGEISTAASQCRFCKLTSDALLEYDQSVQIAVSTLTPFPHGTTVSMIIKDGKASYAKGN